MMNKLVSLTAGAALLALTGTAYAEQPAKKPLALSDQQMDHVTAGTLATSDAIAVAFGEVLADTATQTSTNTALIAGPSTPVAGSNGVSLLSGRVAVGQSYAQALAAGGFFFQAAAAVTSHSSAVW
jgi:hypothetical protein